MYLLNPGQNGEDLLSLLKRRATQQTTERKYTCIESVRAKTKSKMRCWSVKSLPTIPPPGRRNVKLNRRLVLTCSLPVEEFVP